jgi:hypothetical protein
MKENAGGKNIDFFFLDREGMEMPVLRSLISGNFYSSLFF